PARGDRQASPYRHRPTAREMLDNQSRGRGPYLSGDRLMTWRKKNTFRIAASCTLAAVLAVCLADWAWGQGAGGGSGGSGSGVGASSGAPAAGSSGTGATAGAGLSPSAAGSQSQRNEPQSLSAT